LAAPRSSACPDTIRARCSQGNVRKSTWDGSWEASLGNEKISTTVQSYAKPEAVAGAEQRRALKVLTGGAELA